MNPDDLPSFTDSTDDSGELPTPPQAVVPHGPLRDGLLRMAVIGKDSVPLVALCPFLFPLIPLALLVQLARARGALALCLQEPASPAIPRSPDWCRHAPAVSRWSVTAGFWLILAAVVAYTVVWPLLFPPRLVQHDILGSPVYEPVMPLWPVYWTLFAGFLAAEIGLGVFSAFLGAVARQLENSDAVRHATLVFRSSLFLLLLPTGLLLANCVAGASLREVAHRLLPGWEGRHLLPGWEPELQFVLPPALAMYIVMIAAASSLEATCNQLTGALDRSLRGRRSFALPVSHRVD